jgi:hypothetical protein
MVQYNLAALTNDDPFTPSDAGMLAWNGDPAQISGAGGPTNNTVTLIRVNVRQAILVTNVVVAVNSAGVGLTSGQNFAGLYNSAGTLIGTSADQTTPWGTTGLKVAALAGGPFAVPAGFLWVAVLSNTGTSTPQFTRYSSPASTAVNNAGFAAAAARWATNGTGTALPASITPGSNALIGPSYWAGLS